MITSNAGEDVNRNPNSLLVGMKSGTATLEDSLEVSYKTKIYSYHKIQQLLSLVFTERS